MACLMRMIVLAGLFGSPACLAAPWIVWAGQTPLTSGTAVLSGSGHAASGSPAVYHHYRANLQTEFRWTEGDVLQVGSDPRELIYTVTAKRDQPVRIEIRFTETLGSGSLQTLSPRSATSSPACVVASDLSSGNPFFSPSQLGYQLQLYRNDSEIRYSDGSLEEHDSGMTFSRLPALDLLNSVKLAMEREISATTARAKPDRATNNGETCLACTIFGDPSRSWDRLAVTFTDLIGSGRIDAGTKMRLLIAGVPLGSSRHVMPCTMDPVRPVFFLDDDEPLSVPLTGLRTPGNEGVIELRMPQPDGLIDAGALEPLTIQEKTHACPIPLRRDRKVPSSSVFDLALTANGITHLQPIILHTHNTYRAESIDDLLELPMPDRLPGWEDSVALCDKLDERDQGMMRQTPDGLFHARHLNERRILFGSFQPDGESKKKPALWRPHQTAPEILDGFGTIEGANNALDLRLCGSVRSEDRRARPCVWTYKEGQWKAILLPVLPLTQTANAFAINDSGVVCGYCDVPAGANSTRMPCLWKPEGGVDYRHPKVLMVPDGVTAGCPLDINNRGNVAGYVQRPRQPPHACRWEPDNFDYQFTDLGQRGIARGINWMGTCVGNRGDGRPVLWQCGERHDLTEFLGADADRNLTGISDSGSIFCQMNGRMVLYQPDVEVLD